MEFEYSPRHSPGGPLHMLSPTSTHGPPIDGLTAIRELRRSLSRSPSRPARYTPFTNKSAATSPTAPKSPSGLSRAFSADATQFDLRAKSSRRHVALLRPGARRTSPNSPLRRALGDNSNQANATPKYPWRRTTDDEHDRENMDCSEDAVTSEAESANSDEPIKIDFTKPCAERSLPAVFRENTSPVKSSPLKRSDGVMNLETAGLDSPRGNKRRSLHNVTLGADFNVFSLGAEASQSDSARVGDEKDPGKDGSLAYLWTGITHSPPKRSSSLRKSTLQHRGGTGRKTIGAETARDSCHSPPSFRARPRVSLDGSLARNAAEDDSPFPQTSVSEPPVLFPLPGPKLHQSAPKPHPLSYALTPSSSASSVADDGTSQSSSRYAAHSSSSDVPKLAPGFSKSLPLGAMRPPQSLAGEPGPNGTPESFVTPAGYKMAKPLPQAFMSTGLISKRNRNMDGVPIGLFSSTHMPDTPSKKAPQAHIAATPAPSVLGKVTRPMPEFGSPSTPFNGRIAQVSPESFGKRVDIFGSNIHTGKFPRRGSFLGLDGEDIGQSPTKQLESQSSNDDLPPTPTKSTSSTSTTTKPDSYGKSSSLRSSLFGRRATLGPETFTSLAMDNQSPPEALDSSLPSMQPHPATKRSPHTPQESYTSTEPNKLSIPMTHGRSLSLNSSNIPPATPTGPRSDGFTASLGQGHASSGYFMNDVDTALTARFAVVTSHGIGEFSQVYRVEKPFAGVLSAQQPKMSPGRQIWAVKKSRRPYAGVKDRQRKMQEVHILNALRGHEHIVELVDNWEAKNHLYIQTEFCENGNLKDFLLQTGFKGRLDDFRIWKILLELGRGVQSIHDAGFIHLDLKPANVFIDWEGVLKIGDFGLASRWPAPPGLDGEGDREYIGPEVLSGRFDKPADIFSLGMIMLEIAGNIVLPDNGTSWQRLRAGDMSDLPSLTWSSDSSLVRDESGEPIEMWNGDGGGSSTNRVSPNNPLCLSDLGDTDDLSFLRPTATPSQAKMRAQGLATPPNFMVDPTDPEALDRVVQWMICPDPARRPVIAQLLAVGGVQWVDQRRRAGATVYEGSWGPADDVLNHGQDVEMVDI